MARTPPSRSVTAAAPTNASRLEIEDQHGGPPVERDRQQSDDGKPGQGIADQKVALGILDGLGATAEGEEGARRQRTHELGEWPGAPACTKPRGSAGLAVISLSPQAAIVDNGGADIGQIDVGDGLERDRNAGGRAQQQVSDVLGVAAEPFLRAHRRLDDPPADRRSGRPAFARGAGLHRVHHVGGGQAVERQAGEIQIDPDRRRAGHALDLHAVACPWQRLEDWLDPAGGLVKRIEVLAIEADLHRGGRAQAVLDGIEAGGDGRHEARVEAAARPARARRSRPARRR